MSISGIIPTDPSPQMLSELYVLGGIIRHPDSLDTLTLVPDDFYAISCSDAFTAMLRLRDSQEPIDASTLGHANSELAAFFWELTEYDPGVIAISHHAEIVRANATRRHLRTAADAIALATADTARPVEGLGDDARAMIDNAIGTRSTKTVTSGDLTDRVIADIGKATSAAPTPWTPLSRIIHGFRPGALYVIGARPGMGKSALALQIATTLETTGFVGFFSLEMGADEIMRRLISQQAWVPLDPIEGHRPLQPYERQNIDQWRANYDGRILFSDNAMLTAHAVRQQVRTWERLMPMAGIVIDYVGLMTGEKGQSKIEQVTEITRMLKLIAQEFQIPVIALSQLNRNSTSRMDRRPALADLRESGSLEQDADVVILIHNERVANAENQNMNYADPTGEPIELIVAKNRQGPLADITLTWHGDFVSARE